MADQAKKLPIKAITIGTVAIFATTVSLFLILPAFFDIHVSDALFDTPTQPWMISTEMQEKYQFSVEEMQGKYHFEQYCESCHGPFANGQGKQSASLGGRVPNLLDPAVVLVNGSDAKSLEKTINEGIPGTAMPAFPQMANFAKKSIISFLEYSMRNRDKLTAEQP